MKTLESHINEALKIGKNISKFSSYSCQPKTKKELFDIIKSRVDKEGPNCDLNDIDVSLITDMGGLFYDSKFNGDISKWNVSNVTSMRWMFAGSYFNGDISNWDISKVTDMSNMFYSAKFNRNISSWEINKDCDTQDIFGQCKIKEEYKPVLPE